MLLCHVRQGPTVEAGISQMPDHSLIPPVSGCFISLWSVLATPFSSRLSLGSQDPIFLFKLVQGSSRVHSLVSRCPKQ